MPPSFEDIDSKIEKAHGDKARFLESKKGLLPHFEFPEGEAKQEKQYSKETLLADIYEERLNQMKGAMQNPILLENTYKYLRDNAIEGSKKEGENTIYASSAFSIFSIVFKTTDTPSRLSSEQQNEIESYLENPILLENAYQHIKNNATWGSKEEGEDINSASWALRDLSTLITTNSISRLSLKKRDKLNSYLESPILLENMYRDLQNNATQGSKKEGKNIYGASWALDTLSTFITTHALSRLSPEKQNEVNSYFENPILIENIYKDLQDSVTQGSKEEGKGNASSAFKIFSSLTTVKDYLRARGKKIDDENFAKEALNPKKKIPPRPEGMLGK